MPRDIAERKPPSQGALTREEVRRRIALAFKFSAKSELSAAEIAEIVGVSLARVNGHLTALDQANLAVRCNGVGADGQRVTLWRAKAPKGPGEKYHGIRALVLKVLTHGQCETGELFKICSGQRAGLNRSRFHDTLCDMHRRGLLARSRVRATPRADIWSLPPPPAHLGDDGDDLP